MAKYRYTMKVQKIVFMSEEEISVVAENEFEARKLAKREAKKHPELFEVAAERYKRSVVSYTCKPVEE